MKVRLIRKWRDWPMGQVMEVFDTTAKEIIRDGFAEKYTGEYPPAKKMKTEFFKPKKSRRK